jgi:hypothetical protein
LDIQKIIIFEASIKKTEQMKTQVTIESELKRRMDLVENPDFRKSCVEIAKKLGISAKDWNENKGLLLMMWANEVCRIENENN